VTPLHLDLRDRRVLVVGAGPVGVRRATSLRASGARVTIVSLTASSDELPVELRAFAPGDVDGAWLVLACTGTIDAEIAAACAQRQVWCVRADDASQSDAWLPAVARVDDVVISVTAGGDPRRSVALRDAVSLALDTGALPLRRSRPAAGSVALVGGGPGDAGLLTVRGRQLLAEADVVIRDRLAPSLELAEEVEVVETGKQAHGPSWSQSAIEALMVERALAGKRVVRLKGGDVHLFARGIEEVAACVAAGVGVEVVPGVSSAFAAPTWAGIPVTAKGLTQSVSIVSAHVAPGEEGSTVDWDALAKLGGTVVLLMAMERLELCAEALVSAGMDASTPVAVIRDGTLPTQEVLVSTLAWVAKDAEHLRAPAVVVIGDVVGARVVP
jgi:uroporphyrin-III C-methyltransferase/precorrin-2 dehydrogenase/sirohydrochlorin ferrochelatase